MSATIDGITMHVQVDNQILVKELDKLILSRGVWTTILFKYQDWDKRKLKFRHVMYSIRRYHKTNDDYRQISKLNIMDTQSALIAEKLIEWLEGGK